jgi:hypothetical protein
MYANGGGGQLKFLEMVRNSRALINNLLGKSLH